MCIFVCMCDVSVFMCIHVYVCICVYICAVGAFQDISRAVNKAARRDVCVVYQQWQMDCSSGFSAVKKYFYPYAACKRAYIACDPDCDYL